MNSFNRTSQTNAFLSVRDMTLTALMTAVLCVLGPLAIPLPVSPIPVSLTNLVLYFMVYILDFKCSLLAYLVYFLLGSAGLPVFSGFRGGFSCVSGPTGGYLIGFFFQIAVSAYFLNHWRGKRLVEILGLILGTWICYGFGTAWLSVHLHIPLTTGLLIGVFPYLLGDGLKLILASMLGIKIRRTLPK